LIRWEQCEQTRSIFAFSTREFILGELSKTGIPAAKGLNDLQDSLSGVLQTRASLTFRWQEKRGLAIVYSKLHSIEDKRNPYSERASISAKNAEKTLGNGHFHDKLVRSGQHTVDAPTLPEVPHPASVSSQLSSLSSLISSGSTKSQTLWITRAYRRMKPETQTLT
jgi:hypothetical protein